MRTPRWLALPLAALFVAAACGGSTTGGPAPVAVKLTDGKLVIGVINDQSGVYADLSGKNSVEAVNMAVADFKAKYGDNALGGPIEVITADHKNDPALASSKATEFYERSNADIILDVPTSSGALAIAKVAAAQKKLYINITAASTDLTGSQCNKYTFHYAYDTYMLAQGTGTAVVAGGGKQWYIIYPNYAFGQDITKSFTAAVTASGGTVVGSDGSPFPNQTGDFSSLLLKAGQVKPQILGVMQAGGDLVNVVKQYNEFKLRDQKINLAIGLLFDSDIKALGPDAFQGITYTTAWLWTLDEQSRAWADTAKKATGVRPTFAHAGNYSAAWQYMDAVRRAGTDDPDAVVKELEGYQFTDFFARNATIRKEDHTLIHDVYTAQVKPLKENSEEGDYSKILGMTAGKDAFKPDGATSCMMPA